MSILTYIRYFDELVVGLSEVTNLNSVEGNSQLFFEQQKKNNSIYYAPIYKFGNRPHFRQTYFKKKPLRLFTA